MVDKILSFLGELTPVPSEDPGDYSVYKDVSKLKQLCGCFLFFTSFLFCKIFDT